MRAHFLRLVFGMQLAVAASVALFTLLVWRDAVERREDLVALFVQAPWMIVEQSLAEGRPEAEVLGDLEALMPVPFAILEDVPEGAGGLGQDNRSTLVVAPLRSGPMAYKRLSDGRVLRIGPSPRIVRGSGWLIGMMVLGTGLIVGSVGWLIARPTVRRLDQLARAVQDFGEGDLNRRARVPGRGPVVELAEGFDAMAERLSALVDGQRHMLRAASHELRTPHARVRFTLDLLKRAEGEAKAQLIDSIGEDLDEVDAMLSELHDYLRLGGDAPSMARESVDLRSLAQDVVERMAPLVGGVEVRIHGEARAAVSVRWLGRAIENLLTNAVRYAQQRIDLQLRSGPEGVQLWVEDDGEGVPAERRELIFAPFQTFDPDHQPLGGRGLGLAIVARIVRWHGGKVWVEDADGGGARFVLSLPA